MHLFVLLMFSEIRVCRISCLSIDESPFSVFLEEFGRKNLSLYVVSMFISTTNRLDPMRINKFSVLERKSRLKEDIVL